MKKFYIYTLGCKVNNCDSSELSNFLLSCGMSSSSSEEADMIIVNSCAVTSESVRKTRQNINRLKKINKNCILILTGCASTLDQFSKNKNIDFIFSKDEIITRIRETFKLKIENDIFKNIFLPNRTRAFLKIEDGCENFCSYCIIPFVRGRIKSKSIDEIDHECKSLANSGFKEIVLTGINLGKYGLDLKLSLIDAIKIVCKHFSRVRLSSLEPDILDENFIDSLSRFEAICPHFHLSLQSGSDKILKLMNRKYSSNFYKELIYAIRSKFKNSTFATDLIVGFPNETDDDFQNSIELIKTCKFIKVNVFPFSPRPFTAAINMKQINSEIKKERTKIAIETSNLVSKLETSRFFGQPMEVLFECKETSNFYSGYSRNYIRVNYKSDVNLCGNIKKVIFLPDIS